MNTQRFTIEKIIEHARAGNHEFAADEAERLCDEAERRLTRALEARREVERIRREMWLDAKIAEVPK